MAKISNYLAIALCTSSSMDLISAESGNSFQDVCQVMDYVKDSDSQVEIKVLQGREIVPYLRNIAELRIGIFCEYPYLYDGTLSYEESYLSMYSQSENSILIIAEVNGKVVGAITGLPLEETQDEIKQPFVDRNILDSGIFYLGEIVLLKDYRNRKIGYAMYQRFENAVRDKGVYDKISFCEIVRPQNDVKRPDDYKCLDGFWTRQGYEKKPDIIIHFSWKEINSIEETNHPLVFWIKDCH